MDEEMSTMAAVTEHDQVAGSIRVVREDAANVVTMVVSDGAGSEATVFLDYHRVARLMVTLGAAGWQI